MKPLTLEDDPTNVVTMQLFIDNSTFEGDGNITVGPLVLEPD
jgi:hypothetical protein